MNSIKTLYGYAVDFSSPISVLQSSLVFEGNCPTVCVSRWWAGWDSAGKQEKPEARKMLENGAESHQSAARFVRRILSEGSCDYTDNCHADSKALKRWYNEKCVKREGVLVSL
jgi:hypothetical protein